MLQNLKAKQIYFVVGVPFLIYLLHMSLFGKWIIDDAGISFAYSRNLTQGFGLVSQPGAEPVEGFSNLAWVLLFVPFHILKLFHPAYTPKLMSAILVLFLFITMFKIIRLLSAGYIIVSFICLIFLSLNTSFAVWTSSGLENPLYVFLIFSLLYQMIKISLNPESKSIIAAEVIIFLLAITRPEGILYLLVPVIFSLSNYFFRKEKINKNAAELFLYLFVFISLFGGLLILRLFYFKDILPNTYYAKGGPDLADLKNLLLLKPDIYKGISELFGSAFPVWGNLLFFITVILTTYLVAIKSFSKQHLLLFLILAVSIINYFLLPEDWMKEYRFATPFFPILYSYLLILFGNFINKFKWKNLRKEISFTILVIIFLLPAALSFQKRSYVFRNNPTVPFQMVVDKYCSTFDNYASLFHVKNGSLLLPDIGGPLYYSKLKIYDIAGLTDRTIAKTLEINQKDFYDYIFKTIKPTFIHVHEIWAYRANLDSDKRFREDYEPITEYIEPSIEKKYGNLRVYSGNYIRKDILKGRTELLQKISRLSDDSDDSEDSDDLY
ncbi:MAG TPA: hypothetical protein VMT35_01380 [Ignavibacteriaceae bacterium]|nr:hypothetical protein [Ignavibacteriaceae bacterium]